jgi:hypothetical protein
VERSHAHRTFSGARHVGWVKDSKMAEQLGMWGYARTQTDREAVFQKLRHGSRPLNVFETALRQLVFFAAPLTSGKWNPEHIFIVQLLPLSSGNRIAWSRHAYIGSAAHAMAGVGMIELRERFDPETGHTLAMARVITCSALPDSTALSRDCQLDQDPGTPSESVGRGREAAYGQCRGLFRKVRESFPCC